MSLAAARSPSPGPSARPCCGLRRSADSSPFRPAASPPDSPQRSSSVCKTSGRASPRIWAGEKENDPRDASARAHKVRSSGGSGAVGGGVAKSFMAPTISAASKAVAPSATPRKKVLGERNNDPVVAVPSSPGDLAQCSKPRGPHPPPPEEALGSAPRRLRLSLDGASVPPAAASAASHGARHSFGCDEAEDVVVVANPVSGNRHGVASADAEAAVAPYDPKTNFLSPRPRFLRYKPNPRVEMYRHDGGSVRRLEDRFGSENSSEEAEVSTTEEEVSVPDESSEEETSALVHPSEARAQPAGVAVADLPLQQPALDSPRARVLMTRRKKKRFLLAPLALVLMAAAFVCVPPPPDYHPVMLNTTLSKVSDFLSVQELHPVELAARLKQWSSSSLDFVTSYWKAIASYQETDVFGPHLAANLSAAAADSDADYGFYYSSAQTSPISVEQEFQEVVSESETEMIATCGEAELTDDIIQEVVSGSDTAMIAAVEMATCGEADPTDDIEMEQVDVSGVPSVMEEANVDAEVPGAEMGEQVSGSSGEETAAFIQDSDIPSPSTPEPEQAEGIDEASLQQDIQTEDSEGDRADGKEDQEVHHAQKLGSDMWPSYLDKISNPAAVGAALAAIVVTAALAFLYMRQKQARIASNEPAEQVEQVEQAEQVEQVKSLSGSGSSEGYIVAKDSQFQNPGIEETERLGGSGASQFSSSLSSGLGRRRKAKGEDTLGLETGVSRRDSTAQSTSSYGSFTTYQKIPAKKGNKEDEAMTPVRRSSRLRNVKSPEA